MLQLLMAQSDYQVIMSILSGNLTEGQTKETDIRVKSSIVLTKSQSSELRAIISGKDIALAEIASESPKDSEKQKPHIFLKFTFAMEQLIISLFSGGPKEVSFLSTFLLLFKD